MTTMWVSSFIWESGCVCLSQLDDWEHASKLLHQLQTAGLSPVAYPPIGRGLCGLVRRQLHPCFAALYPQGVRRGSILSRRV
jgi:hypothetical protein